MYPEETTIGNLFSTRYPIFVPKYQRSYAWEKDEIDDFINDVVDLYESMDTQNKKHFFGGIVCIHIQQPNTNTGRKFEIVDGQQRLATFYLTLWMIKDTLSSIASEAEENNNDDVVNECNAYIQEINEKYLLYGEVDNKIYVKKPRLTLSEADQLFFQHSYENRDPRPSRESHNRIRFAQDGIKNKLITSVLEVENLNYREKIDNILKLKKCLTDLCYIIHIYSDDKTEAYRLFSVLNDRGISLSDGDLLRSTTLELLENFSQEQDQIVGYWDKILAGKTTETDKFLRCYFASCLGQKPPKRDLFDRYKNSFFDYPEIIMSNHANEITETINYLQKELDIYNFLVEGEWPFSSTANTTITTWDKERLRILSTIFRHSLCFPLLLSSAIKLDQILFSNIVQIVEKFSFRYILIMGDHPGRVEDIYNRYAYNIRQSPTNFRIDELINDLNRIIQSSAPDNAFEQQLIVELNYQQSSKRKLIRYFLTTLESYSRSYEDNPNGPLSPDKMIGFNFDQTTIEHIYPKNSLDEYRDPNLEPQKDKIGNLTIWPPQENQRAGNQPFIQKINNYRDSSVRLNRWISNNSNWTETEFNVRQQSMLEMAKKIFSL